MTLEELIKAEKETCDNLRLIDCQVEVEIKKLIYLKLSALEAWKSAAYSLADYTLEEHENKPQNKTTLMI